MDKLGLILFGLCVFVIVVSGCMSQTPEGQTTGNDQQGVVSPQGPASGQQGQNPSRGPPQEAVDACSGKSANDSCGFTMNGNNVTGNCRGRPNGVLACFRAGQGGMFRNGTQPGQGFGIRLPQEAMDVCVGKSVNDTCEFTMNGTSVQGLCRARRSGNMSCMPSNMGQRPFVGPGGQLRLPPAGQGAPDNASGSTGGN